MSKICFLLLLSILVFSSPITRAAEPDIETYGSLPWIRAVSISPNGKYYAYIQNQNNVDYFVIWDTEIKDYVASVNASKIKARSIYFATNEHVILSASDTRRVFGYRGKFENSGSFVYNIENEELKLLLRGTPGIHPAQTGLGNIVGLNQEEDVVYMPAYDSGDFPHLNLYRVSLETGRGRVHASGSRHTINWFVGENGEVLAREEFDQNDQEHRIVSKISGDWQQIYTLETPFPQISIHAIDIENSALLYVRETYLGSAVYSLSLINGEIKGPLFSRPYTDISSLQTNINRFFTAVEYSGFRSDYEFVDPVLDDSFRQLQEAFPRNNIQFSSATNDNSAAIYRFSGEDAAGTYVYFDIENLEIRPIASEYEVEEIASFEIMRYQARDGLEIPALLTFPVNNTDHRNMPLIALPHGGPESHDSIDFDWMAQYLAAKGYAVLQPNYRGSTGFGAAFRNAGRGKWGREMQDDVSDGVLALVEDGRVDPDRVCIVGSSYGGYSALAGGAFSPELYRCVVSINGVSDLPQMLSDDKRKYGSDHWVVGYWNEVIGDSKTELDKIEAVSPVNFADNFTAPVLLIHGKDDTVVDIDQSEDMEKALKRADKTVDFVELNDGDHWLSTSETRLATLEAIDRFLEEHNPPD